MCLSGDDKRLAGPDVTASLFLCIRAGALNVVLRGLFGTDAFTVPLQLAPFSPGPDGWEDIREAQLSGLALPRVAFISAVDDGDPLSPEGPYHPRDKRELWLRRSRPLAF